MNDHDADHEKTLLHKPRFRATVIWVLVIGLLTVLTITRIEDINNLSDQGFFVKYSYYAGRINAGELPNHRLGDLSPAYLWTLTLLTGPMSCDLIAVRSLQITAVSLLALICAFTAWRLSGWVAALAAGVGILGSRAALVNATEAEPEVLLLLLSGTALCVLLLSRTSAAVITSGVLFGLAATTRPTVLPAVILLGLWLWAGRARDSQSIGMRAALRSFPVVFAVAVAVPLLGLKVAYNSIEGIQTLMNPGTVFYEGANPGTTGLAGDAPVVVKELEAGINLPDALHLAYREVAARALAQPPESHQCNSFWWNKASNFIRTYPGAWLRLEARKLLLALSNHDAYDLATMVRKDRELRSVGWVPFGLLAAAACIAAAAGRRDRVTWALLLFAVAHVAVLTLFYVTARQRLPLLAALALLAGLGAQRAYEAWRERKVRELCFSLAAVVLLAALLCLPSRAQREDNHTWTLHLEAEEAERQAREADQNGVTDVADQWRAQAALRRSDPISISERNAVRTLIKQRLPEVTEPAQLYDLAMAAIRVGEWSTANRVLIRVAAAGYSPLRGAATSSSLAYLRARCELRHGEMDRAAALLGQAKNEVPGDAAVLALSAALADHRGESEAAAEHLLILHALHDPFSVRLAQAMAAADIGDLDRARRVLGHLSRDLPEWPRPQALLGSAEIN